MCGSGSVELRRQAGALLDGGTNTADFIRFVLEEICGFTAADASWQRGPQVGAEWGRRAITGETIKPRHLWRTAAGACLPVFIDEETRLGIGRGRRSLSQVVQWLRGGNERLAVLTNGRQWRLIFAGLDFDAWCEWDVELWFEGGALSGQVTALRTLLAPALWTPKAKDAPPPLLEAILESRKGQAELSAVLGERVREAVELLVQGHGEALRERAEAAAACGEPPLDPSDIYRAAVRVVMRMVFVLFAESRELLPSGNALYDRSYGLTGLIGDLEKAAARGGSRLGRAHAAWPRVLSLFRLVSEGSAHPALPVPAYGGELFAPGDPASVDGLSRALAVFEQACFARELLSDRDVHRMLELITRTRVRLRQGRSAAWVTMPVDFSDLSSEYIGILYEGLLDFELKTAPPGDPVVFLAVGSTPALPLSRLEAMDDRAIAGLLEKMKDGGAAADEGAAEDGAEAGAASAEDEAGDEAGGEPDEDESGEGMESDEAAAADAAEAPAADERHTTRTRAEQWARRAVAVGKLVRKPAGAATPEKLLRYDEEMARKARRLVDRVVLPGEWYVVRWGGTRKGSGTFYTRPGLAVPTVQRTLRPLAFDPPLGDDGEPDADAPAAAWTPRPPEDILAIKVCDPACGSGTFPVAALRYLTDAVYESLHAHGRIGDDGERALVRLIEPPAGDGEAEERLGQELLPCRPDDDAFEPRLKALLRRHVVERCIYGVDLDPLAVELCRLSLWIETMDRELPFSFLDHKVRCGNSLVGAWFDTFRHYPVMAFKNREGGDKGHSNGVHFAKDARGKALKAFVKDVLTPDLRDFIVGQLRVHEQGDEAAQAARAHDDALATLARLHELPVHDAAERARLYRDELLGSPAYRSLKAAMDLWCACWFWPADRLDEAPLPTTLAAPPEPTAALAARIAAQKRFFHWELEFPDVFRAPDSGFDAVLGNPPWENSQPNPEEFFSNVDPLFRTYGRLAKNQLLNELFDADVQLERDWLDYCADFNSFSNWVTASANAFGDTKDGRTAGDRFPVAGGKENSVLHARWREARASGDAYADAQHPFRHQSGRIFTYRLFMEQCHALLRVGGRMGQIIPSGLYGDAWSQPLRELFLDRCRWEWLFGFENRAKVFGIDGRFKFNPVIIEKGGRTAAIRAAFMRRALEDWERAEEFAVIYSREQIARFSPHSRAILEIQSARDLEILAKTYADAVLLGNHGPGSWGVKYKLEFMMNTDAHLFPPRPAWEAKGYRPDEYSRWLLGDWRPIEELWAELGIDWRPASDSSPPPTVNPNSIVPAEIELDDWLFDTSADPERRLAEARFAHGHLLKPGDVARTDWRLRCAQPPYDSLPVPRADIPAGVILSREADAWIREGGVQDVALPLYEGRMIGQFDFSQKGWVSGKGRGAVWQPIPMERKHVEPQYLMARQDFLDGLGDDSVGGLPSPRLTMIDVTSATNTRTTFTAVVPAAPHGHSAPVLLTRDVLALAAAMNSIAFDWTTRLKLSGVHMVWAVLEELPLPRLDCRLAGALEPVARTLNLGWPALAPEQLRSQSADSTTGVASLLPGERTRQALMLEAVMAASVGLEEDDLRWILRDCDSPRQGGVDGGGRLRADSKGFWRVDKDKDPELRHTVLALVAFHDLEEKIRACGGDRDAGIEAFLGQNGGEGWLLPETLRLADHGLGHDERARRPQPVASRLGPRFYDWQLAQSAEESWRECHLHARNLLGEQGYRELHAEIESRERGRQPALTAEPSDSPPAGLDQGSLW